MKNGLGALNRGGGKGRVGRGRGGYGGGGLNGGGGPRNGRLFNLLQGGKWISKKMSKTKCNNCDQLRPEDGG